jgi:hypothetical protein
MSFKDKVFVSFISTWAIALLGAFLLANDFNLTTFIINCLAIILLCFMAVLNITTNFFKE